MAIKNYLSTIFHNFRSLRSNRRIIIFQSDDWGAIRTPSIESLHKLSKKGIGLDNDVYSTNDALESKKDLENLFDVLSSFKDKNGNFVNFTSNYVVANPNFKEIKESEFQRYSYETIDQTYERYFGENLLQTVINEGIANNIWTPQIHGREHLNVSLWISALVNGIPEIRLAFEEEMFALTRNLVRGFPYSLMEAFNARTLEEAINHKEILSEAVKIFKNLFGFDSISFIAPNYIWGRELEETIFHHGIKLLQCGKVQKLPIFESGKIIHHYTGEENRLKGHYYITRNCNFEPTTSPFSDDVDRCLGEVNLAFKFKVPVVINTHRINYISSINPRNANDNLKSLRILLKKILKKWPNVEFMDTPSFLSIIK